MEGGGGDWGGGGPLGWDLVYPDFALPQNLGGVVQRLLTILPVGNHQYKTAEACNAVKPRCQLRALHCEPTWARPWSLFLLLILLLLLCLPL